MIRPIADFMYGFSEDGANLYSTPLICYVFIAYSNVDERCVVRSNVEIRRYTFRAAACTGPITLISTDFTASARVLRCWTTPKTPKDTIVCVRGFRNMVSYLGEVLVLNHLVKSDLLYSRLIQGRISALKTFEEYIKTEPLQ